MFSTVNHFQTCKPGRVNLTVVLNTDYCQTLEILYHLNENYNILINIKGDIGCKISSFAYICVLVVCRHNHSTMIQIHSLLFLTLWCCSFLNYFIRMVWNLVNFMVVAMWPHKKIVDLCCSQSKMTTFGNEWEICKKYSHWSCVWWWIFGSRSAFKVKPEVFSWPSAEQSSSSTLTE